MFGRPNVGKLKARIDVAGLVEALNHKDDRVGEAAAQALGELAEPHAFDVWPTILGKLKEFHAEDALIMCYRDNPSARLRTAVALALEKFHASGRLVGMLVQVGDSEGLLHATTVGDGFVALEAARASKRMSDPRPIDALVRCLSNADTQRDAAEELGRSGDVRALRPLVAALQDEMGLAPRAAEALGELGNPDAIEPLVAALERARAIEESGYRWPAHSLRVHAGSALAQIPLAALTPSALAHMSSPALVDALVSVAEAGVPFFLAPGERTERELVEAEDRFKSVKHALEVLAPERSRAVSARVGEDLGSQVREGEPASAPDARRVQLSGNSVWEELANYQAMASRQGALLAALTPIEETDARSVFARIGVQSPNRYDDQMTAFSGLHQYAMTAEGSAIKVWHLTLHEGSAGSDFLYVHLADAPPLEFLVCALTGGRFLGRYATGSNLKEALNI